MLHMRQYYPSSHNIPQFLYFCKLYEDKSFDLQSKSDDQCYENYKISKYKML